MNNDSISAPDLHNVIHTTSVSLLDVRTPIEYARIHIEHALNIDFYTDTFFDEIDALPRDAYYVVYCKTGARSGKTLQYMKQKGFLAVKHLEGGIQEWASCGYKTTSA